MHKPNINRLRQPVPAPMGKQVRIQPQNSFNLENQTVNGLRPRKNKKHKRR